MGFGGKLRRREIFKEVHLADLWREREREYLKSNPGRQHSKVLYRGSGREERREYIEK